MIDPISLTVFWSLFGLIWLFAAWASSHGCRRRLGFSAWVALSVVAGPLGCVFFIVWLLSDSGPVAPSQMEIEQEHRRRLAWLRSRWDSESITLPELVEFARLLEETLCVDESVAVLERAIELQPGDSELWRQKGRLHWRLGQRHEEALSYERAESLSGPRG